jgi:hypothetical protein
MPPACVCYDGSCGDSARSVQNVGNCSRLCPAPLTPDPMDAATRQHSAAGRR